MIQLPRLLMWYRGDFTHSPAEVDLARKVTEMLSDGVLRRAVQLVVVASADGRFRLEEEYKLYNWNLNNV
jgi:hypothetical protein